MMYIRHTMTLFMELWPWRVKGRGICRVQTPLLHPSASPLPSPTLNVDTTPREQLIPGHARGTPFDRDQSLRSPPDKSLSEKPIKSGHVLEKVRLICVRNMRNFYAIILVIRENNREDKITRFLRLSHGRNKRRIIYFHGNDSF